MMRQIILISFILVSLIFGCENRYTSKNVDLDYFTGFWQNIDDPNDYLLFGHALNDNNTTEGFFGPVDLAGAGDEGKEKKYYGGGFTLTQSGIIVQYNEHNSLKPRIEGFLFVLGKNEIELPFGIYNRVPLEKAKAISGSPDFDQ